MAGCGYVSFLNCTHLYCFTVFDDDTEDHAAVSACIDAVMQRIKAEVNCGVKRVILFIDDGRGRLH